MVVLNLTLAVAVIAQAKPEDRVRAAVRQGGALTAAAGAWLGDHAGTATYDYITRLEWL